MNEDKDWHECQVLDRVDHHRLTCLARSHLGTSPRPVHKDLQRKGVRFKPDASRQLRYADARSDSQGQLQEGTHNSLRVRVLLSSASSVPSRSHRICAPLVLLLHLILVENSISLLLLLPLLLSVSHTHTHTHAHTYTHIHTHTHIHIRTYIHNYKFTLTYACTSTSSCTPNQYPSPLTRSTFNRGVGGGEPNDNWEDVCCRTANQCETDADCGEQSDPEKVGPFASKQSPLCAFLAIARRSHSPRHRN